MSSCETLKSELVAFDRGELAPAEENAVRSHVASCAACARELARLRRTVELVARATDLAPDAGGSARLRSVVEDALIASAAERTPIHDLALRRRMRDAWDDVRVRYERSAGFRRFTLASIGVHAAAAVLVAVLLARSSGGPDRPVQIRIEPAETAFTLPDGTSELEGTASLLPSFDAARPDGVAPEGVPGARFPNHATAARWGATATAETRRAALRVSVGAGAAAAEFTIDRGLAWLEAQRRADGTWPADESGAPSAEATAAAVLAFAGAGRTSVEDPGLANSVAWLERNADASVDFEERALALRALTAQFVADFGRLPGEDRARRSRRVGDLAARLESDVLRGERVPQRTATALATAAALADARTSGLHDGAKGLAALVRGIEWKRTPDGRLTGATRDEGVALTASLAEIAADAGARPFADAALSSLRARLVAESSGSTRDAARGAAALAALGRPLREPVAAVALSQRGDGSWTAQGAPSGAAARPDAASTAYGVLAVTRAFRR